MEAPKKEIIIAVIFGLITGALFSFTIWMIKEKPLKDKPPVKKTRVKKSTPTPAQDKKPIFLTITSPEKNPAISQKDTITLEGESFPKTNIIVSTEQDDFLITTDKDGKFSKKIDLKNPITQIYLTCFDQDKNSKTQLITIYYEKEK